MPASAVRVETEFANLANLATTATMMIWTDAELNASWRNFSTVTITSARGRSVVTTK